MDGTIQVPGIGPIKKKTALATGAVLGVLLVIMIVRRKNAASSGPAPASPATAQQTDPAGNTGTIDPATGYVQGSAEDQAALAGAQSAAQPYDTTGLGAGLGGYYYGPGGATQTSANPPGPGNFADNAEWSQYALAYLTGTLNADAGTAGAALGAYLAGQDITPAQQTIVEEAEAVAGQPPQAGPGGYPPRIRLVAATKPPKPAEVTVPNVAGKTSAAADAELKKAGLKESGTPHGTIAGHTWVVRTQTPKAGSKVTKGTTVHLTFESRKG
jgi:hypothetical protein